MPLYRGYMMVGFAKVYTMLPVFSLVLGRSVPGQIVITYPELNKVLAKGRFHLSKDS